MHRNKKSVLILGVPASGKTYSLKELINEEGDKVAYINTDGKLNLPFRGKNKIGKFIVPKDPLDVLVGVRKLEEDPSIEYIVIDTLSFWVDQIEQQHVIFTDDSRGNWGKKYAASIKDLLFFANNVSTKSWIFLSHVQEGDVENYVVQTKAYAKGSVGKLGIEAYFDTVLYTNVYMDDNSETGVGYRFQTKKTKETIGYSVRSPDGMFPDTFTKTNDIIEIFDYIDKYEDE